MRGPGSYHGSDIFQAVADVIGVEATEKLCRALGGTRLYVPATIGAHHPIAVAVGPESAAKIADHFHRTVLALPKGLSRRERVLELRRTTEMTVQEIALATDYTEAGVYKILAEERGGQLDLFNTRIR
ncbi:hypothetical protein [Sphingobium ummariense]|uniref:Mor transcription activator domain-containing protein n=1 Tax=Sphingobium ummariense RL-3 TaxID=1346791 RepID=T0IT47_9SPHN|nr:hypothetical protein [Sphingobium ummariense]EQB32025.1 hypothetical protein M529_11815 [Sphingobium ummariense RL-3]